MKKLFVTLTLGLAAVAFAQEQPKTEKQPFTLEQRKQMQQKHLDKMQKDLNLTPEQVQKIKVMQDKHFSEMDAAREKNMEKRKQQMEDIKAKKNEHEAEMKKILTPEQFQKWQQQRDENIKKGKEMWKENGGKRGHRNMSTNP